MNIEDMADLITMYDTQEIADKLLCLVTGDEKVSTLEYTQSGLCGNYMRLEKMIERNCCEKIINADMCSELPIWTVILTNRELKAEDRAAILLGYDEFPMSV
ncbi:MAG: hypothetical protein NC348_10905 [Clostridium sp.]|nr:hypothetical protein [Clostridium sp.]